MAPFFIAEYAIKFQTVSQSVPEWLGLSRRWALVILSLIKPVSRGLSFRIGGDEFCVLIDDHNTCDISHLICCLRKEEAVYNASSRNIHLQIACGYAVFDSRTDADLDALQKRADQNMYENKKQLKTFSYR